MDLGDFLLHLAATYDRSAGLHSEAQGFLRQASEHLAEHVTGGMVINSGGGKGMATYTPWVGFFDPDETESPQRGIYAVYILSEDLEAVTLTLNQGMEQLRTALGDAQARLRLQADAEAVRSRLPADALVGWDRPMDLRSTGARQREYTAANIACRVYSVGSLPAERELRSDLAHCLQLYSEAIAAKRDLLLTEPGVVSSPSSPQVTPVTDVLRDFKPKDSSDYRAVLVGRELVKSRRHERMVAEFGAYAMDRGFLASTEHPQDLVLRRDGATFLVEAKVLYRNNATHAVRGAVGQLLSYSRFLYTANQRPVLVGLFSEPIGDAYVEFLDSLDVLSVWRETGSWIGSPSASTRGLVA